MSRRSMISSADCEAECSVALTRAWMILHSRSACAFSKPGCEPSLANSRSRSATKLCAQNRIVTPSRASCRRSSPLPKERWKKDNGKF